MNWLRITLFCSVKRMAWLMTPWPPWLDRQRLVGPHQARQDRQARGVGRGPAQRAEAVASSCPRPTPGRRATGRRRSRSAARRGRTRRRRCCPRRRRSGASRRELSTPAVGPFCMSPSMTAPAGIGTSWMSLSLGVGVDDDVDLGAACCRGRRCRGCRRAGPRPPVDLAEVRVQPAVAAVSEMMLLMIAAGVGRHRGDDRLVPGVVRREQGCFPTRSAVRGPRGPRRARGVALGDGLLAWSTCPRL